MPQKLPSVSQRTVMFNSIEQICFKILKWTIWRKHQGKNIFLIWPAFSHSSSFTDADRWNSFVLPISSRLKCWSSLWKWCHFFGWLFFFFCFGTEQIHYKSARWLMALNRYRWRGEKKTLRQRYQTQRRQVDSSAGNEKAGRNKEEWMFSANLSCSLIQTHWKVLFLFLSLMVSMLNQCHGFGIVWEFTSILEDIFSCITPHWSVQKRCLWKNSISSSSTELGNSFVVEQVMPNGRLLGFRTDGRLDSFIE